MLIGQSIALVSLGINCQPAFQMRHHHALIEGLTGVPLEERATPFDWLLCDVPGVARMIADGAFYPSDLSELKVNGGKPYWSRYGVHFWHQKWGGMKDASGEKWLGRARHVAENWNLIRASGRRVFIISNSARLNVERALADREMTKTALDLDDLRAVYRAIRAKFGRVELHVVTAQTLGRCSFATIHPTVLSEPTNFKGSASYWERLFRIILHKRVSMTGDLDLDLISDDYRKEQERLHADPRGYGSKGSKWTDHVHTLLTKYECERVLDYGCGQNSLCEELNARGIQTRSYDPAIPQFAKLPKATDLLVCTDVLEHIEPERLEFVLTHIVERTLKVGFFVISTVETDKTLSDGRNAHISLHPREWWIKKLLERFKKVHVMDDPELKPEEQLVCVVIPRDK